MTGQLDLFTWAAEQALTAATAATEKAQALRGAARRSVEQVASKAYQLVSYWRRYRLGVQ
ncbi:MAG: hypothetical protein AB7G23_21450 [Vicinamibacterales bacterium]